MLWNNNLRNDNELSFSNRDAQHKTPGFCFVGNLWEEKILRHKLKTFEKAARINHHFYKVLEYSIKCKVENQTEKTHNKLLLVQKNFVQLEKSFYFFEKLWSPQKP